MRSHAYQSGFRYIPSLDDRYPTDLFGRARSGCGFRAPYFKMKAGRECGGHGVPLQSVVFWLISKSVGIEFVYENCIRTTYSMRLVYCK